MFQSDTNNTTLTKIKQASLFYGPTLETRPNNSVPLLTRPNTPQGTKTAAALPKEKEDDNIQRGSRLLLLLRTLLISCILTIALVYFMPTQKKSNEGGMARIEQQTENLKVSLHNPKWDEQEAGKVILNQYNSTFDPTTQAKNMNINMSCLSWN